MTICPSRRTILASALAFAVASPALAAGSVYTDATGAAASGHDVVAYFTESRPVNGSDAFTAQHDGATWRFASAANRDAFLADPARYAPQYGGYCAYAVAKGSTASTVPEAWTITDGKLYLNYSKGVQSRWEANRSGYITDADANWPDLK